MTVDFLIDSGAQMSVVTTETAEDLNRKPGRCKVKRTGMDGVIKECPTAKITLWLPGEKKLIHEQVLIGAANTNILGLDLLDGKTWKLPDGSVWSFTGRGEGEREWFEEDEPKSIHLLQMSVSLSPSKITNMRQDPLPAAAHLGIMCSWPVKKINGQWQLTTDYG